MISRLLKNAHGLSFELIKTVLWEASESCWVWSKQSSRDSAWFFLVKETYCCRSLKIPHYSSIKFVSWKLQESSVYLAKSFQRLFFFRSLLYSISKMAFKTSLWIEIELKIYYHFEFTIHQIFMQKVPKSFVIFEIESNILSIDRFNLQLSIFIANSSSSLLLKSQFPQLK